jgi:hypothetical protein
MSPTVAGISASSSGAAGLTVSSAAADGDAPASDGSAEVPGSGVPTATWPPSPPSALSNAEASASTSDAVASPEAAR